MTHRHRVFRAFAAFSRIFSAIGSCKRTHSRTHSFHAVARLQSLRSLHVQQELGRDFEYCRCRLRHLLFISKPHNGQTVIRRSGAVRRVLLLRFD